MDGRGQGRKREGGKKSERERERWAVTRNESEREDRETTRKRGF